MGYIYLIGAIISEVFGSSMLKLTATIKSKLPMIGIIVGYLISFYLLSLALISIPLSFSYAVRSEEHTSELQSRGHLVCRLLLEKKKKYKQHSYRTIWFKSSYTHNCTT